MLLFLTMLVFLLQYATFFYNVQQGIMFSTIIAKKVQVVRDAPVFILLRARGIYDTGNAANFGRFELLPAGQTVYGKNR